jgi:hypothetical protein
VLPQFVQRANRDWVNTNFGDITDRLNAENKQIVAAQPAAHGFQKADMKPEFLIVTSQFLIPPVIYNQHDSLSRFGDKAFMPDPLLRAHSLAPPVR